MDEISEMERVQADRSDVGDIDVTHFKGLGQLIQMKRSNEILLRDSFLNTGTLDVRLLSCCERASTLCHINNKKHRVRMEHTSSVAILAQGSLWLKQQVRTSLCSRGRRGVSSCFVL